jgi:hypothetical protein
MITDETHRFLQLFKANPSHHLKITFNDLDIFVLRGLNPIDPSVYGSLGQWTGEIVEAERTSPRKKKVLIPGLGLDFKEEDVGQVFDMATAEILFSQMTTGEITDA